jgi:hypothetical protein
LQCAELVLLHVQSVVLVVAVPSGGGGLLWLRLCERAASSRAPLLVVVDRPTSSNQSLKRPSRGRLGFLFGAKVIERNIYYLKSAEKKLFF